MRTILSTIALFTLFNFAFTYAQNTGNKCPPLFTHERTINPEIKIVNIEVIDSNKFESLPKFKGNIENISKKIVYPEIAKRAGIDGIVKFFITIDSTGKVINRDILNALGAGIEYTALDVILKEKYYPAVIDNKKISSQMAIEIYFDLNLNVDMPEMEIDEIKYEFYGGMIFLHKTIIFKRDGSAYYSEDRGYEPAKIYNGKINGYEFTKLNDFILAQCFFNYDTEYSKKAINDTGKTIITVKSGDQSKSVMSKGQLEPVGLWAIRTVILQEYNQIKWEEVKE